MANIKRDEYFDIYIGRSPEYKYHLMQCKRCQSRPLDLCHVGLEFIRLGNPYELVRDGTRGQVIELFREYATVRFMNDDGYREMVMELDGKVAGCFCHPLLCHGSVYDELIREFGPNA